MFRNPILYLIEPSIVLVLYQYVSAYKLQHPCSQMPALYEIQGVQEKPPNL